jgi:hypothetical protein
MHSLGVVFVDVIIALFFLGLAGSGVVIVISFVEDFHELFDSDDAVAKPAGPPRSTATTPASASFTAPKKGAS